MIKLKGRQLKMIMCRQVTLGSKLNRVASCTDEVYKYEVILGLIYLNSPKLRNTYHLPNLHDIVF